MIDKRKDLGMIVAVALCALPLGLTGCGGDDESGSGSGGEADPLEELASCMEGLEVTLPPVETTPGDETLVTEDDEGLVSDGANSEIWLFPDEETAAANEQAVSANDAHATAVSGNTVSTSEAGTSELDDEALAELSQCG